MKHLITLVALATTLSATAGHKPVAKAAFATCTGSKSCKACKNC
ncbi:hypothetical protein [Mucilaginibacter lacusdianchii]|nr:hypothetical protein [Mucilaginibacter sp. JXJ CY 39]